MRRRMTIHPEAPDWYVASVFGRAAKVSCHSGGEPVYVVCEDDGHVARVMRAAVRWRGYLVDDPWLGSCGLRLCGVSGWRPWVVVVVGSQWKADEGRSSLAGDLQAAIAAMEEEPEGP